MPTLHSVDWTILAIYFALTMFVGVYMTRRASSSLEHYFLAGRSLPWYLLGIAGMANWFDMTGTMIITSFLFMLGPRGLFIEFRGGAVLILAFMLVYTGKWHRRSGCLTAAEWMTYRFGAGPAAEAVRVLTAVTTLIWTVGALGYLIRGCILFMDLMLPYPPLTSTVAVIGVATLYTMLAGFYGVVLTDLIQGLIIIGACVVVSLMAWHAVPDAASLGAAAAEVTGNGRWLSSVPHAYTSMPPGYEPYRFLLMMAAFYLLRNVLHGMGSGAENRYFGARSDRDCGLQSLLQGLTVAFRWPMMMGFAVLGIYLVQQHFPDRAALDRAAALVREALPGLEENLWHERTSHIAQHPEAYPPALVQGLTNTLGPQWSTRLALVGYHGSVNPERVLPAVLIQCLPAGLRGLLLVAMFAALMSTLTGTVNGSAAQFVRDIYQNLLRPRAGNRELIALSWIATLGLVAGGYAMGLAARSINDIWGWLIMGLGAGGLAPGLLRLYWWRCNAWGCFGGLLLGGLGAIVQRIVDPRMPEVTQFLLISALSFAGTISVSLATRPAARDVLRHFYRTTRPFGRWGPVRATFDPAEQRELTREHRCDMLAVPFALLAQITLFLLPMQLVIKAYGSFLATLPLFLLGAAGLYAFWYRQLPPATAPAPAAPPTTTPAPALAVPPPRGATPGA